MMHFLNGIVYYRQFWQDTSYRAGVTRFNLEVLVTFLLWWRQLRFKVDIDILH